ncbi:MAG: T9SS type A sorting domain-containing protein [Bacteroidetes bacterium]|nr:T9SS type A sorting domain-containing protein [Bacteroidota bacterium]
MLQYRIKPTANLPLGTQIRNTANIYFDYNAPIITNTTINEFVQPVSIGPEMSNLNNQLYVYPNPGNGIFNLKTKQLEDLKINSFEVFDLLGQKVFEAANITISSSSNFQIDLTNYPNGIYFVKANGLNKSFTKKIIKN